MAIIYDRWPGFISTERSQIRRPANAVSRRSGAKLVTVDPMGSFGILLEITLRGPGSCVSASELTAMRFRPI